MGAINKLTSAQEERLDYLIEEASEVIKAASKIKRHGYESGWNGSNNRDDLHTELADFIFAVHLLNWSKDIDREYVDKIFYEKAQKPPEFLHFQKKAGY